jgi:transcriptional regulator with XRE-family HTH domain
MTPIELKELRKRLGLSQTEAAGLVHVSQRTWARYESGAKPVPPCVVELFLIKANKPD